MCFIGNVNDMILAVPNYCLCIWLWLSLPLSLMKITIGIQRLRHVMASRQSSHSMTSYPQQIAVPFAVCIFGGFGEIALAAVTTKNTRMSNRSANTKMV